MGRLPTAMPDAGQAYIVNGPVTGDLVLSGYPVAYGEGCTAAQVDSVQSPGDLNEDGLGDVLVTNYCPPIHHGSVGYYVTWLTVGSPEEDEESRNMYVGRNILAVGDVVPDGHPEVLVGQDGVPSYRSPPAVIATLYRGPINGPISDTPVLADYSFATENMAASVRPLPAGDLSGDGMDDLLLSADGGIYAFVAPSGR